MESAGTVEPSPAELETTIWRGGKVSVIKFDVPNVKTKSKAGYFIPLKSVAASQ